MGLFSFTQEIAIDLGTANTIIIHNGKIVVDEPSMVALDKRTDKLKAVGETARQMHGKTHENIRTLRPLRDGVIADFYAAEQMIRGMVKMVNTKTVGLLPLCVWSFVFLQEVPKWKFVLYGILPNMPEAGMSI